MPLYVLLCPVCRLHHDAFARASERAALACPACGASPQETDWGRMTFRTARVFVGRESRSYLHGFAADDVPDARRALPGWDIRDDGTVHFRDRSHYRSCMRERASAEAREAQIDADTAGTAVAPETLDEGEESIEV